MRAMKDDKDPKINMSTINTSSQVYLALDDHFVSKSPYYHRM